MKYKLILQNLRLSIYRKYNLNGMKRKKTVHGTDLVKNIYTWAKGGCLQ